MAIKTLDLKVADYMSPKPLVVKDNSSFSEAIQIMADTEIGNLVVEKHRKPIGILTERQILENLSIHKNISDVKLKNIKLSPFEIVSPTTKVIDAAQLMMKKKTRLLVFDAKRLVGIITATDMVRAFRRTTANPNLSKVRSTILHTVNYDDSILAASKMMYKKRIGSVIVLKNNKPYGIFTERDLLVNVLANDVEIHNPVGGYCTTPLVKSSAGIKGGDASKIMSKNKIKRLVLTKAGKYYAIVTARDIVESFTTSFSNEE
ncbi:MAG: CBS domain-containing protein [Thaumarchaeota archaeon]|nr:CBS domain-containing protein [Nitrososphaerota archaeon]